jgi:PAS domain-containing protein
MSKAPSYNELEQRVKDLEEIIESSARKPYSNEISYRNLIEQLPHEVRIWTLVRDETGKIKTWKLDYANIAALNSWGNALDDIIGKTTDEVFPEGNGTEQFMPATRCLLEATS